MKNKLHLFSIRTATLPSALLMGCLWIGSLISTGARALELNWEGQFRAESHWVYNYSLERGNNSVDTARQNAEGYYIPGGGNSNAFFQTLFLKLRPSVVVNDNVYIKSEWWVGDPVYSFFGDASPYTSDQKNSNASFSRGSSIRAQRVWAEFLTDAGTLQVGRAPLHWGLGVVWNSGDDVWDRYVSTGDLVRLVSKFGRFSVIPSAVTYSIGNSLSGGCTNPASGTPCNDVDGGGSLVDYSLIMKYENPDQEVEMGFNFIRRLGGVSQNAVFGYNSGSNGGMTFNTIDLYGRKSFGDLSVGVEVPIVSGQLGDAEYSTFGAAIEVDWDINRRFDTHVRLGHASGQGNIGTGSTPDQFKAFFFHPGYRVGMIMFNYNLAAFAGPNTQNDPSTSAGNLRSPFDQPIVNANYLAWSGAYQASDKWKLRAGLVYANALETASAGTRFYNTWQRKFVDATADQSSDLGWELDLGTTFNWDESFQFKFDLGWFFPGEFYAFSNTAQTNSLSPLFATTFRVGLNF